MTFLQCGWALDATIRCKNGPRRSFSFGCCTVWGLGRQAPHQAFHDGRNARCQAARIAQLRADSELNLSLQIRHGFRSLSRLRPVRHPAATTASRWQRNASRCSAASIGRLRTVGGSLAHHACGSGGQDRELDTRRRGEFEPRHARSREPSDKSDAGRLIFGALGDSAPTALFMFKGARHRSISLCVRSVAAALSRQRATAAPTPPDPATRPVARIAPRGDAPQ